MSCDVVIFTHSYCVTLQLPSKYCGVLFHIAIEKLINLTISKVITVWTLQKTNNVLFLEISELKKSWKKVERILNEFTSNEWIVSI